MKVDIFAAILQRMQPNLHYMLSLICGEKKKTYLVLML